MSNLSIFKIGVGPSSSHTLGPIIAANAFCKLLENKNLLEKTHQINCTLFGSLSLTGKGHLSDKALLWGLSGITPKDDIDGSEVAQVYYTDHNINRISTYCQKDVIATIQVYLRLRGEATVPNDCIECVL